MARVRHPAPFWSGTALWNDDFEELSLDNYKGIDYWCACQLSVRAAAQLDLAKEGVARRVSCRLD